MECIICGNNAWRHLFTARDRMFGLSGRFKEYKCTKCGFVRLYPKLSRGELSKYYPSTKYYSYGDSSRQGFFGNVRSYLISHLYRPTLLSELLELFIHVPAMPRGSPGTILDIGCGSGDTLVQLQNIGWQAYGLDVDASAVAVAHKRGLTHVSLGSYEKMEKYPDNFFDAIRLYHVIEHLGDPGECLRLVYKKLKPGGEIIIGTPSIDSLIARIAKQYWYNLDCPRHLFLFTPRTLGILLKKKGFIRQQITFCSAGGWVGSIQYKLEEVSSKDIDLINQLWLVMFFYPLEWILDKAGFGDVFVLRAIK